MDSGTFEAVVRNVGEIDRLLAETEGELAKLNARRTELLAQITALQQEKASFLQMPETPLQPVSLPSVTNPSPQEAKIHLFRNLFRGREDVYPKRFESLKTGKKGYQVTTQALHKSNTSPTIFYCQSYISEL